MNATQLKYARERAKDIYNNRRISIQQKYTIKPLPVEEALKVVSNGAYSIREPAGYLAHAWYNWIVFKREGSPDPADLKKEQKELDDKYQDLMDELILGDNEEALKLLKAFDEAT